MFVVANIVLDVAKDDVDKADMVQKLLKDIWDRRQAKLRTSVYFLMSSEATYAKLNFLQSIELNAVRPLLPQVRPRKVSFISSSTDLCSPGLRSEEQAQHGGGSGQQSQPAGQHLQQQLHESHSQLLIVRIFMFSVQGEMQPTIRLNKLNVQIFSELFKRGKMSKLTPKGIPQLIVNSCC